MRRLSVRAAQEPVGAVSNTRVFVCKRRSFSFVSPVCVCNDVKIYLRSARQISDLAGFSAERLQGRCDIVDPLALKPSQSSSPYGGALWAVGGTNWA